MPRHPKHDYRSRCIYHIILTKARGVADFSGIVGHGAEARVEYTPLGRTVASAFYHLPDIEPRLRVLQYCVMPDHLHLLLDVTDRIPRHLGAYIAEAKTAVSQRAGIVAFEPGYYDCILWKDRSLDVIYRYIRENPRRLSGRAPRPSRMVPQGQQHNSRRPFLPGLWQYAAASESIY